MTPGIPEGERAHDATVELQTIAPIDPMALLVRAVDKGADVDQLTKLMDLRDRWEAARENVLVPKLLIVLDSQAEDLMHTIQHRGRPFEQTLTRQILEQLGAEIRRLAAQPDYGPVLWLDANNRDRWCEEVIAAVQAMEG